MPKEKTTGQSFYFRLDNELSKKIVKMQKETGAISKAQIIRQILLEYFRNK